MTLCLRPALPTLSLSADYLYFHRKSRGFQMLLLEVCFMGFSGYNYSYFYSNRQVDSEQHTTRTHPRSQDILHKVVEHLNGVYRVLILSFISQ